MQQETWPLCGAFLRGRNNDCATELDELEEELLAACRAGREAWPQVDVPADAFAEYLGTCTRNSLPTLKARHVSDLWLACGCGLAISSAQACFETRYFP